jgi:hypothetical protein
MIGAITTAQPRIQFFNQGRQLIAEKLVGFPEPAELRERGELKIVLIDAQAVRDVIPDRVEPLPAGSSFTTATVSVISSSSFAKSARCWAA